MGIRDSETNVVSNFSVDRDGNPTGGRTLMKVNGDGSDEEKMVLLIEWQHGIVPPGSEQNGAFVEDVLEAARQRIQFFNQGRFRCRENSLAITKIEEALQWLDWRTRQRLAEGVENTYETHKPSD